MTKGMTNTNKSMPSGLKRGGTFSPAAFAHASTASASAAKQGFMDTISKKLKGREAASRVKSLLSSRFTSAVGAHIRECFDDYCMDDPGEMLMWLEKWVEMDDDGSNLLEYPEFCDAFDLDESDAWSSRLFKLYDLDFTGTVDFPHFFETSHRLLMRDRFNALEAGFRLLVRRGAVFLPQESAFGARDAFRLVENRYKTLNLSKMKARSMSIFEYLDENMSGGVTYSEYLEYSMNENLIFVALGHEVIRKLRDGLFGEEYWHAHTERVWRAAMKQGHENLREGIRKSFPCLDYESNLREWGFVKEPEAKDKTDPLRIDRETMEMYKQVFDRLDADGSKSLDGKEAALVLRKSRLPKATLKQIWKLSDVERDGTLDENEFAVALHLILCVARKDIAQVPDELPDHLLEVAKTGGDFREATREELMDLRSLTLRPRIANDDFFERLKKRADQCYMRDFKLDFPEIWLKKDKKAKEERQEAVAKKKEEKRVQARVFTTLIRLLTHNSAGKEQLRTAFQVLKEHGNTVPQSKTGNFMNAIFGAETTVARRPIDVLLANMDQPVLPDELGEELSCDYFLKIIDRQKTANLPVIPRQQAQQAH